MYPQRSVMTCGLATALEPPHFNHAPVRGATRMQPQLTSSTTFQSTHPRGVRHTLNVLPLASSFGFQSTHPRGVRLGQHPVRRKDREFQSTHPRGVRRASDIRHICSDSRFNPRTRVGCDSASLWPGSCGPCFNPRTRVGCDKYRESGKLDDLKFQSTHPRGVRLVFIRLAYS